MAKILLREEVNAVQLSRSRAADQWLPGYRKAIRTLLRRQTVEAVHAFQESQDKRFDFSHRFLRKWTREMEALKKAWMYRMVAAGYQWADQEFGPGPTGKQLGVGSPGPDVPLTAVVGEGDEFLIRARFKDIDRWVDTTAEAESRTKAKRLQSILERASKKTIRVTRKVFQPTVGFVSQTFTRGMTVAEIAKAIRKAGLVTDDARASMLARTGTIWAFNEGAKQRYRVAGVTAMQWVVTDDDALCEFCSQMDGKVVTLDTPFVDAGEGIQATDSETNKNLILNTPFTVEHPPLHPNCRCTVVPVMPEA